MGKLAKIISYVLFALIAVTVVFIIMFFTGGDVPGEAYTTPVYTDAFLNWAKILIVAAAAITLLFEVFQIVVNPKKAARSLISIAIIAIIAFVSYSLADGTPLTLGGYEGSDNVAGMLKLADVFLFSTYALIAGVILSIIVAEVSKLVK